jgi:FtsH-binding integral membrane protein
MNEERHNEAHKKGDDEEEKHLQTFLQEIRVLIPGAQIVGAFLFSVPFQSRFEVLSATQRMVFIGIFLSTIAATVLFLAPAAYHRLANPIRHKRAFVRLGTWFIVAGFVGLSASLSLSVYLVASMLVSVAAATAMAGGAAALVVLAWWVIPLGRLHDAMRGDEPPTTLPSSSPGGFPRESWATLPSRAVGSDSLAGDSKEHERGA